MPYWSVYVAVFSLTHTFFCYFLLQLKRRWLVGLNWVGWGRSSNYKNFIIFCCCFVFFPYWHLEFWSKAHLFVIEKRCLKKKNTPGQCEMFSVVKREQGAAVQQEGCCRVLIGRAGGQGLEPQNLYFILRKKKNTWPVGVWVLHAVVSPPPASSKETGLPTWGGCCGAISLALRGFLLSLLLSLLKY